MKILNVIVCILISLNLQSQTLNIDTTIWGKGNEQSISIRKIYSYRLYHIDSTWVNSKLQYVNRQDNDPEELSKLYLDSLSTTSSYLERKKLPDDSLPDEFYIFYSNIITSDWSRKEYRALIYYNKKKNKGIILFKNRRNTEVKRIDYSLDSIKPLISNLNKLIVWDTELKYSVSYGDIVLASNDGSINLVFKYGTKYYRNSFEISWIKEYGMSYELGKIIYSQADFSKEYPKAIANDIRDIRESDIITEDKVLIRFLMDIK